MSERIVIHSKTNCPYCVKAKDFLKDKGISFQEIVYDPTSEEYETLKNALLERTNFKTFPQIFVGAEFVGGYTDLVDSYSTLKFHQLCKNVGIEVEGDF